MATTTAGAFVSATVNGYTVKTSPTTATMANATDKCVSATIVPSTDSIENKKLLMGMDIQVVPDVASASLEIQASHNGTDWVTVSVLDASVAASTGVTSYLADLSGVYAPNFRLAYNDATVVSSVGTDFTTKFFFAWV